LPGPSFDRIGPYESPEFKAEGGMAWVYKVRDLDFPRPLALKVLKPEAGQGEELRLFEREAELLATMNHPNLITIFRFGRDEATGYFYYSMSWIDGPSLSQLIHSRPKRRLDPHEAVELTKGVLAGLAQLHARGVVHRDIKPGNILVDGHGNAVLMDLGIARVLPQSELTQYTSTNVIRGTPLYMSPEQSEGRAAKPSSDIFSVGLTLYCMLTGHTVYDDAKEVDSTNPLSVRDYLGHLRFSSRNFQLSFPKEVPRWLREVTRKACNVAPETRYEGARAMLDDIQARQGVGGIRTGLLAAAGAALLALLLLGVGGYRLWWYPRAIRAGMESARAPAEELDQRVPGLLESVKDLDPPLPDQPIEEAEAQLQRAQNALVDAQEDAEFGGAECRPFRFGGDGCDLLMLATANFKKAESFHLKACDGLAPQLRRRADEAFADLDQRARILGEGGAEARVPDRWPAFQASLAELTPPAEGTPACEIVESELARLEGVRGLETEAGAVEIALRDVLTGDAEKACAEAVRGQGAAQLEAAETPVYERILAEGNEALESGERLREAREFLAARGSCQRAVESFRQAQAVATAWKVRSEAERLEREITLDGRQPPAKGRELIRQADTRLEAGEADEAEQMYRNSVDVLAGFIGQTERSRAAQLVLSAARAARESAVAEGADTSAAALLAQGDVVLGEGEEHLEAGRFEEAERRFRLARKRFDETRSEAIENLKAASGREAETRRQLAGLRCDTYDPGEPRRNCEAALTALEDGGAALLARNAPQAVTHFREALDARARADAAEAAIVKLYPPEIEDRKPKRETVEVRRNQIQAFSVVARDPNPEDTLRYAWSFEGQPLRETSPNLELVPERSGTMVATVSDSTGRKASTEWELVVKNLAPELALSVPEGTLRLEPGASRPFEVTASDPDGDPVQTVFLLDGNQVASGSSYTFSSGKPGEHVLEIVGTDAAGASTRLERRIEVAARTPTPPPPPPGPTPPANRPPTLALSPGAAQVSLAVGESHEVRASTSDPDGDRVSTEFRLDGRAVGSGSTYRFAAEKPGSYQLDVVATDPSGAVARKRQTIQVKEAAATEGWRVALQRYERALERKDMKKLQDVWLLPKGSPHRMRWENRFRRPDPLEIDIAIRKVDVKGDRAVVVFDQTESQGTRTRTYKYQAVLLKRATTNDWQIVETHFLKT
jgi:hypothetical protein